MIPGAAFAHPVRLWVRVRVSLVVGASEAPPHALLRAVSRWQTVGLAINDVVGSGIYLLPVAVAALLGAAGVWAMPLAGLALALALLVTARVSNLLPVIGALGVGAIIFHFRRPDTVERAS